MPGQAPDEGQAAQLEHLQIDSPPASPPATRRGQKQGSTEAGQQASSPLSSAHSNGFGTFTDAPSPPKAPAAADEHAAPAQSADPAAEAPADPAISAALNASLMDSLAGRGSAAAEPAAPQQGMPVAGPEGFETPEDPVVPSISGLAAHTPHPQDITGGEEHPPHSPESATSVDGFVPDEEVVVAPREHHTEAADPVSALPPPGQASPQPPSSPGTATSDDGFGTFEVAAAPAADPQPAPEAPSPSSDTSNDAFGTWEDAAAASAAPVPASTPDAARAAAVDLASAGSCPQSHASTASDEGFGSFDDAPSQPQADLDVASAPQPAPQPPEPSGSQQSDASDDGFGTFEDAPSRPEPEPEPEPAAVPQPAQQPPEPPDSLKLSSQDFLQLAQRLFAPLAAPSAPVSLPDIVRACDDMEAAAMASLPDSSPVRQHWCQPHRTQVRAAAGKAQAVHARPLSSVWTCCMATIECLRARACPGMPPDEARQLISLPPEEQGHLLSPVRMQAGEAIQPLVWHGSRAEAAMLRLLGLEAAAQEAAEAAAALQRQQAQARARRTSSQKISQSLPGNACCSVAQELEV